MAMALIPSFLGVEMILTAVPPRFATKTAPKEGFMLEMSADSGAKASLEVFDFSESR